MLLVIHSTFTHWVLDGYFLNVPTSTIGRYLGGYFVKILNMCPVGIWVGKVWAKCKINQNGPSGQIKTTLGGFWGGYFLKILNMYLVGI